MMTILYPAYGNLYVNLTNKCPCACTFCLRQTHEEIQESGSLWLEREPTVEEVDEDIENGQNFQGGQSPQTGPPNLFPFGVIEPPEVPTSMELTPMF